MRYLQIPDFTVREDYSEGVAITRTSPIVARRQLYIYGIRDWGWGWGRGWGRGRVYIIRVFTIRMYLLLLPPLTLYLLMGDTINFMSALMYLRDFFFQLSLLNEF